MYEFLSCTQHRCYRFLDPEKFLECVCGGGGGGGDVALEQGCPINLPFAKKKIFRKIDGGWTLCMPPLDPPMLYKYIYELYKINIRERSCSVEECLTRDRGAVGLSLTGVTALWSLSKTHLSQLSSGSTQDDPSLFN